MLWAFHLCPAGHAYARRCFRDAGYKTASIGKVHVNGENKQSRDLGFEYRPLRYYTYGYKDYEDAIGKELTVLRPER